MYFSFITIYRRNFYETIFKCDISIRTIFLSRLFAKTNSDIKDVIPVVKLLAGQTDSILVSDLFYAENYDLTFKKNPNIKIDYLKESKTLVLQAGDDYEGMTLVDFDYSGQTYSIPVTVELLQSHTFSFAPNKNTIQLISLVVSINGTDKIYR